MVRLLIAAAFMVALAGCANMGTYEIDPTGPGTFYNTYDPCAFDITVQPGPIIMQPRCK